MDNSTSVVKVREILMVTMPADPDDSTVASLQQNVLGAMERYAAKGVILDISLVDTFDSFFARTISETAQMVMLMGGRALIVGMQPTVAVTATQMGLALSNIETALNVDRALDQYEITAPPRKNYR
jgi:rsbT antagonist protein RsbS